MTMISARKAAARLDKLIDGVTNTHTPMKVVGKRHEAVLISAADWASLQETLHLLSIPGMLESIQKGAKTPLNDCDLQFRW